MQFLLFISLFFFSLALASPADVHYLGQLIEDEAQLFDAKDLAGFANLFTKNATYNPDTTNVHGMNNIEKILSRVFLSEVISQSAVKTKSFALLPTFNGQGAAGTATGTVYTTISFIGQGNLTGQVYTVFAEHNDMYVKTEQFARYGGWKISERFFVEFYTRKNQKSSLEIDMLKENRDMASIQFIILWAILAIAMVVAVPIPNHEQGRIELHQVYTPLPDPYPFILPFPNPSSLIEPVDNHTHRGVVERRNLTEVVNLLLNHKYICTHLAHVQNAKLAHDLTAYLNSTKGRRLSSVAGRVTNGAMQGLVSEGTQIAGDSIADELTGNDRDHPQKTKQQVVEEEKEDAERSKEQGLGREEGEGKIDE
ncbi:hypothetical protein MMC22_008922 [Lobaria immixta]|nr:hypothetical protein [Lobaria immixta]